MFNGPLMVGQRNSRYFTDLSGRAVYLAGSHTWANFQDIRAINTDKFSYDEYLDMMERHNHNFMRMWQWGHPEMAPWTQNKIFFEPMPYERTGPGEARDGKPRFDLDRFSDAYFERLRSRVTEAGKRGIYVSVMLFEGWCMKNAHPGADSWAFHPFNASNNINGVNGDADGDGRADIYSLENREVLKYQENFIAKVIDTLNDLDNVLFEIINEAESSERAIEWQYHMIDFVHGYEKLKTKQHPVGMTASDGEKGNAALFAGPADWISPGRGCNRVYQFDPPAADGSKVIISDTDHLWGHGGDYRWVWKSFLRGLHPIFMDPWEPTPGNSTPGFPGNILNSRDYPDWELLRANLGYTLRFAKRIDLISMRPFGEFSVSGYCLANPGKEYLIYSPDDNVVTVDLSTVYGKFHAEWLSPVTGRTAVSEDVEGGAERYIISPLGVDVVLYLYNEATKCPPLL